jgi:hypothetical protein
VTQHFVGEGEVLVDVDARKEMFQNAVPACVLLRKNFWNSVPLQKYPG